MVKFIYLLKIYQFTNSSYTQNKVLNFLVNGWGYKGICGSKSYSSYE